VVIGKTFKPKKGNQQEEGESKTKSSLYWTFSSNLGIQSLVQAAIFLLDSTDIGQTSLNYAIVFDLDHSYATLKMIRNPTN
jgi:hypothetical protein